jgi:hypothetical protein
MIKFRSQRLNYTFIIKQTQIMKRVVKLNEFFSVSSLTDMVNRLASNCLKAQRDAYIK